MHTEKRFEVIGGKIRPVAVPAGGMPRCTDCKIKTEQLQQERVRVRDLEKQVRSLKEELQRVQSKSAEKREAYSNVDLERLHARECIKKHAISLTKYLKYIRIVLWTLWTLHRHPPGGFCVLCARPEGEHDVHCIIGQIFEDPGAVIVAHKDAKIDEGELPIPQELHVAEIEPMAERPWGMYQDLKKECHDHTCGDPPLKGKLWCWRHMPRGY